MGSDTSHGMMCLEQGCLLSVLVEGDGTERDLGMGEAIERNRLGT